MPHNRSIQQFIVGVVFLLLSAVAYAESRESERMVFDETTFDFGTIKEEKGKVSHRFKVTNKGKKAVAIVYARSGCNCIRTESPSTPIEPGKSAYITVSYNPKFHPGEFKKEVSVVYGDRSKTTLKVKGKVIGYKHPISERFPYDYGHGLYMNLGRMVFGTVRAGEEKTMKLRFANEGKKSLTVSFTVKDKSAGITVPSKKYTLAPGEEAEIPVTVSVKKPFAGNRTTQIIPVRADGLRLKALEITMTGNKQ